MLLIELTSGQSHIPLPITRSGEFRELVRLPAGVERLALLPVACDGPCQNIALEVKRCSVAMRAWQIARRTLPTFWQLSLAERRLIGLNLCLLLTSPLRAYQLASSFIYHSPAPDYSEWLLRFDTLSREERSKITHHCQELQRHGLALQVIVDARQSSDEQLLVRALNSLKQQLFHPTSCILLVAPNQSGSVRPRVPGWVEVCELQALPKQVPSDGWSVLLQPGCYLAPHALYWFGHEAMQQAEAGLIYSDHDHIDEGGVRSSPHFKPDWSAELALASGYPGRVFALRNRLLSQLLTEVETSEPYALLMAAAARLGDEAIYHIPALLWQQDNRLGPALPSTEGAEQFLKVRQVTADIEPKEEGLCLHYPPPEPRPLVSIVVPTHDLLSLLRPCIESILTKTTYSNYEVIIVDNQSREPQTLAYFASLAAEPRIRVLNYDRPFNYAAINNFAVQQVRGSLICLLNNDTEVINPEWLDEMVSHIAQEGVGVVGAKLYYSDGTVQHGGDVVGVGGVASHLHAHLTGDAPGYMSRAVQPQDLSAVTAACLLTWRDLYLELGGLDQEHLPVAYNDVDYCLRVRERGKRVIFTPYARLYHYESVSRGGEANRLKRARTQREERYFRKRWKRVLGRDPFYNPNLSQVRADFSLSHAPMVKRPW